MLHGEEILFPATILCTQALRSSLTINSNSDQSDVASTHESVFTLFLVFIYFSYLVFLVSRFPSYPFLSYFPSWIADIMYLLRITEFRIKKKKKKDYWVVLASLCLRLIWSSSLSWIKCRTEVYVFNYSMSFPHMWSNLDYKVLLEYRHADDLWFWLFGCFSMS